jgi:hypothetical protein
VASFLNVIMNCQVHVSREFEDQQSKYQVPLPPKENSALCSWLEVKESETHIKICNNIYD